MRRVKIVEAKLPQSGYYGATIENTRIRQRDKLEETIVNLATFLGAKTVQKALIRDGSYIYSVDDASYQGLDRRGDNCVSSIL